MVSKLAPALASVTLVPLPPKSHSTTTPLGGNPGADCSAESAATESGTSAGTTPPGARFGLARSAPRSAPTFAASQCAGTAITTGVPPPTVRAIASRASTSTCSPRCGDPSAATNGTGSPTRSTNPLSTMPGWLRLGFSAGTPTSGARSSNTVSTDRRITGGRPIRAATRLVMPIDNPRESLIYTPAFRPNLTIAARRPYPRHIPLTSRDPLTPGPLLPGWQRWVSHRSLRRRPWIASCQAIWLLPHISPEGRRVFHG